MNKKNMTVVGIAIILIILVGGYFLFMNKPLEKDHDDSKAAEQFKSEYSDVASDNVFVYRTADEVIRIMEHGTGVVYLGYPECPWCQAYVPYLNEVAKEVGVEKIYYLNTKKLKEEAMDKYEKLIEILHGHLQYKDDGTEWIYVPNVSFHIEGSLIANDYETSKDTHGLKDPKEYWTDEEVADLKSRLRTSMERVDEALNVCTDCNK